MIGVAIFTNKMVDVVNNSAFSFGWSFILGWLGFIGAIVSAVVVFLLGKQDD